MTRTRRATSALLVLTLAATLLVPASAGATTSRAANDAPAPVVAILLAPFLTWDDLSALDTPDLAAIAQGGAVANMNSVTADAGWPTVAGGVLSIGAGRWASSAPGIEVSASRWSAFVEANRDSLAVPDLGALGATVREAGGRTAAVGNADEDSSTPAGIRRPAELLAADREGRVDFSATSTKLTRPDASAPFGVRSDAVAVDRAIDEALAVLRGGTSGGLLVVDPGDLSRAHDVSGLSAERYRAAHRKALVSVDDAARHLVDSLPKGSLLLIVAPATDKPWYVAPLFGPVIASGRGMRGMLDSASTRRTGLVTNSDIAATALDALGLRAPRTMLGKPATASGANTPIDRRITRLTNTASEVAALDRYRDAVFIRTLAWILLALFALCGLALAARTPGARIALEPALLLVLALVPASWLMLLIERPHDLGAVQRLLFFATTILLAIALFLRRHSVSAPLVLLTGTAVALILADQWLHLPYAQSGLFSYSTGAGWRYYGLSNEAAALLVSCSLVLVALIDDALAAGPVGPWVRRLGVPIAGLVVIVTAAAPFAGANAGVAVWGMASFALAWVLTSGRRFRLREVAITAGLVLGAVIAFALIDRMRTGETTHLVRFAGDIVHGRFSAVGELIRRKAANNIGYLLHTNLTLLVLGSLGLLGWLRVMKRRPLDALKTHRPALRATLTALVAGGVVALLTEDSGVAMPAMLWLPVITAVLFALLAETGPRRRPVEDVLAPHPAEQPTDAPSEAAPEL